LPWCSIPKYDRIAAELAATHTSASLYQFGLIHVRAIPPTTTCKGHRELRSGGSGGRGQRPRHPQKRTTSPST
jgi:hypothetical protein